jgi:hypothetical protein
MPLENKCLHNTRCHVSALGWGLAHGAVCPGKAQENYMWPANVSKDITLWCGDTDCSVILFIRWLETDWGVIHESNSFNFRPSLELRSGNASLKNARFHKYSRCSASQAKSVKFYGTYPQAGSPGWSKVQFKLHRKSIDVVVFELHTKTKWSTQPC